MLSQAVLPHPDLCTKPGSREPASPTHPPPPTPEETCLQQALCYLHLVGGIRPTQESYTICVEELHVAGKLQFGLLSVMGVLYRKGCPAVSFLFHCGPAGRQQHGIYCLSFGTASYWPACCFLREWGSAHLELEPHRAAASIPLHQPFSNPPFPKQLM